MGLLSNPNVREKVRGISARYSNKLAVLFYVGGLAGFLALAYQPFNNKTYFSENALLPGLVESEFYKDFGAGDFLRDLKAYLKTLKSNEFGSKEYRIPSDWLLANFQSIGLETHVQNFTFSYPVGILKDQVFEGQNFYAIHRAPKAASTESIVLAAPYRAPTSELGQTFGGIALMYGLAKSFRRHTYWAKDIIFLVTEHEHIGMQAWLAAYHDSPAELIKFGELPARSGSIQAAVNLELASDTTSRLNIKLEGLNGQLPNLDLVNTVVRLCRREGIKPTLQKRTDHSRPEDVEGFKHSLKTMMKMMWNQATGTPTGNHGLFHRYHIEAVTLQGVKMKQGRSHGLVEVGRVVEGVFRSLNNLLERFHQSFFFYLLPGTERYVSIGNYMPPFGLLAAAVLIKAIALWIGASASAADKEEKGDEDDKQKEAEVGAGDSPRKEGHKAEKSEKPPTIPPVSGLVSILPQAIMSGMFGLAAYCAPRYAVETAQPFRMPPGDGLLYGFLALQLSGLMFPRMLRSKAKQKGDKSGADWQTLKCTALVMEGLLLFALGTMNISLAFFLAVVWVPVTLLIHPSTSRLLNLLQYLLLMLISPLGLLFTACFLHNLMENTQMSAQMVVDAYFLTQRALLMGVVDNALVGSWMFSFVTLLLFPNWLMFWSLLWTNPS